MEDQRALGRSRGSEFSVSTDYPLGSEEDARQGFHSKVFREWAERDRVSPQFETSSGQGSLPAVNGKGSEGGFR